MSSEIKSTPAAFHPNVRNGLARFNAVEILAVLVGLALCSTGALGMIVGIPVVIGALYSAFFVPPKFNRGLYLGKCPHCGAEMSATHYQTQVDCPSCGEDSAVRDNRFVAIIKPSAGKAA